MEPNPKTPPVRGDFGTQSLHVFVLLSLAFAGRMYELLGRQPAFFVVRQSHAADVLLWVLALSFLLPGMVVALLWLVGLPALRLRQAMFALVVLVAMIAIVLAPLKRLEGLVVLPGPVMLGLGMLLGLAATAVYFRFAAARRLVTILSPAAVLFPLVFALSPSARLVCWNMEPPLLDVEVGNPVPVVLIVFDEFSGISLMDAGRRIDPVRFPNLAAFAREATWYRNATTMSTSTHHAVPAILSGDHPHGPDAAPTWSEYPRNLFTLLGRTHRLVVQEAETYLCPAGLSGVALQEDSLPRRFWSLLVDSALLDLCLLLPADGPFRLPDVSGRWGNFLDQDREFGGRPSPHTNRREQFDGFLERVWPSQKPDLVYAHLMLPHVPWNYLPTGQEYAFPLEPPWADSLNVTHGLIGLRRSSEHWTRDPVAVTLAYQRYLLQLGFVDRLAGRLIDHLKKSGLYDQSMIILTADHGVSCRPDHDRRNVDEVNAPDILSIPLLVKLPHQRDARTSDRNVQTADLLPTIAEVLKINLPWQPYGKSVLDRSRPEPAVKEISREEPWEDRLTFDGRFEAKYEALAAMLAMGGAGQGGAVSGQGGAVPIFAKQGGTVPIFAKQKWDCPLKQLHQLLGRRPDEFEPAGPSLAAIELTWPEQFADMRIDGPDLPCYICGRVMPGPDAELPLELAIAVNGTIRAVTRTFQIEGLETAWAVLVPETSFRPGRNEIRLLVVSSSGGKLSLHPTERP